MINPIEFLDEVYKDIEIDDVKPIYAVSNYGSVINKITGQMISMTLTNDGYLRVGLATKSGGSKHFLVHRLVMMTFHPIDNSKDLEVNHLYGKKIDNYDKNLEWTTGLENCRHAFRTGLNKNIAETHANATLTNEQVRFICASLQDGKSIKFIESELGDTNSKNLRREINAIKERKAWNSISKDYTFPEGNERNKFTDNEVFTICKMLENGYNYKEILTALGIDVAILNPHELSNFNDIISNIRIGRYYRNISENFNMKNSEKSRYDQYFSESQIHEICKMLENGIAYSEILNHFNIRKDTVDQKTYDAYRHCLYRIKNRKQFVEISSYYNF